MVAESMVIFAPMFQLGCCRARSLPADSMRSRDQVRNGPPDAVRWIRASAFPWAPNRHWKMAECSESTGRIRTPQRLASAMTRDPAATRVSLFARAMSLPARMAESVGLSPLKPTIDATTMSTSSPVTRSQAAPMPAWTWVAVPARAVRTSSYLDSLQMTACGTENSRACSAKRAALLPAVMARTSKRSGCCRTTSSVWLPMDPVDPRMAILFRSMSLRN